MGELCLNIIEVTGKKNALEQFKRKAFLSIEKAFDFSSLLPFPLAEFDDVGRNHPDYDYYIHSEEEIWKRNSWGNLTGASYAVLIDESNTFLRYYLLTKEVKCELVFLAEQNKHLGFTHVFHERDSMKLIDCTGIEIFTKGCSSFFFSRYRDVVNYQIYSTNDLLYMLELFCKLQLIASHFREGNEKVYRLFNANQYQPNHLYDASRHYVKDWDSVSFSSLVSNAAFYNNHKTFFISIINKLIERNQFHPDYCPPFELPALILFYFNQLKEDSLAKRITEELLDRKEKEFSEKKQLYSSIIKKQGKNTMVVFPKVIDFELELINVIHQFEKQEKHLDRLLKEQECLIKETRDIINANRVTFQEKIDRLKNDKQKIKKAVLQQLSVNNKHNAQKHKKKDEPFPVLPREYVDDVDIMDIVIKYKLEDIPGFDPDLPF